MNGLDTRPLPMGPVRLTDVLGMLLRYGDGDFRVVGYSVGSDGRTEEIVLRRWDGDGLV